MVILNQEQNRFDRATVLNCRRKDSSAGGEPFFLKSVVITAASSKLNSNIMLIDTIKGILIRDLNKLHKEIESYQHESNIWIVDRQIANSAGNLCLHLIGNLNTYIGKELGGTSYVRNRDQEFSLKDVPRTELLQKLDETIKVIDETLSKLPEGALQQEFPVLVFKDKTSIEYMLVHNATHLGYHLGQVNYHRRLLDTI
jgi:Protein of unknown function (DUF1572)